MLNWTLHKKRTSLPVDFLSHFSQSSLGGSSHLMIGGSLGGGLGTFGLMILGIFDPLWVTVNNCLLLKIA